MQIKNISINEHHATFKLGETYIVVETNSDDKVRNFQNGLIIETLLEREHTGADMSPHNILEIVSECRCVSVMIID